MRPMLSSLLLTLSLTVTPPLLAQGLKHVPDEVPPGTTGSAESTPTPTPSLTPPSRGVDDKTTDELRSALVRIVNTALSEGRFDDLAAMLSHPDRLRTGDASAETSTLGKPKTSTPQADLQKAIAAFRRDYHDKFNRDFELKADHLKNATFTRAADANTILVSLSELEKNPAVKPATPPGTSGLTGEVPPKPTGGMVTKDVAGETGLSVVSGPSVTFVKEGRAGSVVDGHADGTLWKLNIPNEITGKQLQSNLARHIQKLADQKSTWTDADATARAAASAVLQAMVDSTIASE